jgi:hypothetical protein
MVLTGIKQARKTRTEENLLHYMRERRTGKELQSWVWIE